MIGFLCSKFPSLDVRAEEQEKTLSLHLTSDLKGKQGLPPPLMNRDAVLKGESRPEITFNIWVEHSRIDLCSTEGWPGRGRRWHSRFRRYSDLFRVWRRKGWE